MTISKLFNDIAPGYDRERYQLIPCFNDFYRIALEIAPFSPERELRILDLGAGTGILAKQLAGRYPRAQLTLIDISPQMLHCAEQKFSAEEKIRTSFLVADYLRTEFHGNYDLIVSALSIHHLDHDGKQMLFARIFASLERGGMFINCDQVRGATPLADKMYARAWRNEMKSRGASKETIEKAQERMREDRPATIAQQLGWLDAAGFREITTWYQYYCFVIYSAMKAD